MTESLGRAVLALETDATGLAGGLGKAEQQTQGWLGRVSASFKRLSSSTVGGALLQGVGLGAGLTALNLLGSTVGKVSELLSNAVNDASALGEAQSKVNVVFGEGSAEVTAWAETAAEAFGQSKRQALEAAGTYGNLFQAFGIGREKASQMSMTLVELAADLASFNNTSIDDALLALRSGLSGETEPLKRYGIAINDARLRTALAEQGIKNLGATLTAEQKAVGAYALIMQDSSLAQGDFGRTSDQLANQQRILAAQMEDVSAELGEKLLPVMLEFARWVNSEGIPILRGFVDSLDEIGVVAGSVIDAFQPLRGLADDALWLNSKLAETGNTAETIGPLLDKFGGDIAKVRAEVERWAAAGISFEEGLARVSQPFKDWPSEAARGMTAGKETLNDAAEDVAATIPDAMLAAKLEALGIVAETPGELANALLEGLDAWEQSWATMEEAATREMEQERRIRNNLARLTSQELIDGLRSDDAIRRAAAEQTRADLIRALTIDGYRFGYNLMATYAAGVRVGQGILVQAAANAMTAVRYEVAIESEPKSPTSPLRGITRWGGNIVRTIVDGIRSEIGLAGRGASELAGALAPSLRMPELGLAGAASRLGGDSAAAGVTYQWVLEVNGVPKTVGRRDEVLDEYETMMGYTDRRPTL